MFFLVRYNLDLLKIRRKRNMLKLMYDQSRENENVHENQCNITLRSVKKIKMKSALILQARLTKVKKSPSTGD